MHGARGYRSVGVRCASVCVGVRRCASVRVGARRCASMCVVVRVGGRAGSGTTRRGSLFCSCPPPAFGAAPPSPHKKDSPASPCHAWPAGRQHSWGKTSADLWVVSASSGHRGPTMPAIGTHAGRRARRESRVEMPPLVVMDKAETVQPRRHPAPKQRVILPASSESSCSPAASHPSRQQRVILRASSESSCAQSQDPCWRTTLSPGVDSASCACEQEDAPFPWRGDVPLRRSRNGARAPRREFRVRSDGA